MTSRIGRVVLAAAVLYVSVRHACFSDRCKAKRHMNETCETIAEYFPLRAVGPLDFGVIDLKQHCGKDQRIFCAYRKQTGAPFDVGYICVAAKFLGPKTSTIRAPISRPASKSASRSIRSREHASTSAVRATDSAPMPMTEVPKSGRNASGRDNGRKNAQVSSIFSFLMFLSMTYVINY